MPKSLNKMYESRWFCKNYFQLTTKTMESKKMYRKNWNIGLNSDVCVQYSINHVLVIH